MDERRHCLRERWEQGVQNASRLFLAPKSGARKDNLFAASSIFLPRTVAIICDPQ
jgi:hypothetical protein